MSQALKRIEKELQYFNGEECEDGYTAGPIDESIYIYGVLLFKVQKILLMKGELLL